MGGKSFDCNFPVLSFIINLINHLPVCGNKTSEVPSNVLNGKYEDINSDIKYVQISTNTAPFSSMPLFSMKIISKIDKRYNIDSLRKIFNFIDDGELKII